MPRSGPRSTSTRKRLSRPRVAVALVAAALVGPPSPAETAVDPAALARTARENALRAKQLELASGKDFYLVLDPSGKSLSLYLKAAVLQTWSVEELEVGAPRIAFVSRGVPADWEGRIWRDGALDPPRDLDRFELVAPPPRPDGTDPSIPIPPLPEEAIPVPPRYRVVFEGGLAIEVRPPDAGGEVGLFARIGSRIRIWARDFARAVSPAPDDRVRIRLALAAKDAASLYRALPPKTALLILPPDVSL